MKKYLRDTPKSLLLIVGLSVLFFLIFNVIDLLSNITEEQRFNRRFENIETVRLELNYDMFEDDVAVSYAMIDEVLKLSETSNCNVSIKNIPIYFAGEIRSRKGDIILCVDESLKMNNRSGREITLSESTDCMIIGETLAETLDVDKSDSVSINNQEVRISEIKGNSSAGGVDNSVYFIWQNCSDELKTVLIESMYDAGPLTITFESDKNIQPLLDASVDFFQDFGCYVSFVDIPENTDYQNVWYKVYNEIFLSISIAFTILSTVLITELWISGRKKELIIRRTYGYGKWQLFKLLYVDYFKLSLSSLGLALILQLFYSIFFDLEITPDVSLLYKFLIAIPLVWVFSVCVLIVSIIKNRTFTIAEEIRGE